MLTQGKDVLRGDRLLVDMTTGVSRVESDRPEVQGLFSSSRDRAADRHRPARGRLCRPSAPQINRNNINYLAAIAGAARG